MKKAKLFFLVILFASVFLLPFHDHAEADIFNPSIDHSCAVCHLSLAEKFDGPLLSAPVPGGRPEAFYSQFFISSKISFSDSSTRSPPRSTFQ